MSDCDRQFTGSTGDDIAVGGEATMAERVRRSRPLSLHGWVAGAALLGSLVMVCICAPSAGATVTYLPEKTFPVSGTSPASFSHLLSESIGFDEGSGHIYVADSGQGKIYNFASASDTAPTVWTGSTTPSGSFGGLGGSVSVAVYSATGDVYVADKTHAVIDKFDSSGNLVTSFGDSLPSPNGQLSGANTPAGSFSPASHSISAFAIAVNQATGELYVVDAGHEVIDVFSPSGAYLRQITAKPAGLYTGGGAYASGIAVDAAHGLVYISDWGVRGKVKVYQFESSGAYLSTWDGATLPNGAASEVPGGTFGCGTCALVAVATEEATGHVIISGYNTMNIFDSAGNFLPPQLTLSPFASTGVAVQQSTGDLFLSYATDVVIYKRLILPDGTAHPASSVTARSAVLNAHVDPAGGGDITNCVFEYISDSEFGQNSGTPPGPWSTARQRKCDADFPPTLPYSNPTDVSVQVEGLTPGTGYHTRVILENANGAAITAVSRFETVGSYGFASSIGSAGSGDGQLEHPEDVALDNSSGDLYVADTGNHRVVKFDSTGKFIATWGWGVGGGTEFEVCTSGCQAGLAGAGPGQFEAPAFIEVDNSDGPSKGDVYVADAGRGDVQKFDPSGGLVESWGNGGAIDFSGDGPIQGITVDNAGSLFVGSEEIVPISLEPHWTEIGQDGVFRQKVSTKAYERYALAPPDGHGIDINSFGSFYQASTSGGVSIAPGGDSIETNEPVTVGDPTGLVVDRRTGDLYVSHGTFIYQFPTSDGCFSGSPSGSSNCHPTDTFGGGQLSGASGLAFDPSTGTLYVANSGANRIAVFTPRPAPAVTTEPVTFTGPARATLNGHLDPLAAGDISDCYFEYGTDSSVALGTIPCEQPTPISHPSDVTAEVAGLSPFTSYFYRLVAVPADGVGLPSYGRELTFTANPSSPPSVDATASSGVTQTSATVTASINPHLGSTTYVFQYGTNSDYGSNTLPSDSIGEDNVDHTVSVEITGLSPGTAYHFRVVAVNFSGTTAGPDETFTTPGAVVPTATEPIAPRVVTPSPPGSAPDARCAGLAHRAQVDSRQATALRERAKHASNAMKARALRRQAGRLAKQARQLSKKAKQCAGSSGKGSQ